MSLRPIAIGIENATRARQFVQACRIRAMHENLMEARAYCEARSVLPEVKAAIAAGTTTSLSAISQIDPLAQAFLESLRQACAFDALLPSMRVVPFQTRIVVTTTGASGSVVAENTPKPITSLALTNHAIAEAKATAITVMTKDLLQLGGPAVMDLFERELRGALAVTTDTEFLARITAGLTPLTSAGPSAAQIRTDAKLALVAVDTTAQSRLFWIVSSSIAKSLATKGETDGASAFLGTTPMGGTFFGAPLIVSDGLASNTMVLVDASRIAAASGPLEIASSGQASLQMDTVPTNPPVAATVAVSLWQNNLSAVRLERYFGAERLGNSVAVIGGVAY